MKNTSKSCPKCGRLIEKVAGICPYCEIQTKDKPPRLDDIKIEKEHLKKLKTTRSTKRDKSYGMKKRFMD